MRKLLPDGVHLTQKEWEVLDLLNEGLSSREIARRLFVADVTVRTHVAAIVRKLGVANRVDAVRVFRGSPVTGNPIRAAGDSSNPPLS
jgi:DNA-binding NarL/FixJ family response regulator